jgi:hypothetical protein
LTGKLGPQVQHLIGAVRVDYRWTAAQTESSLTGLDVQLAPGALTPEQQALAVGEREIVSERNLLFAGGVIGGTGNGERGGLLRFAYTVFHDSAAPSFAPVPRPPRCLFVRASLRAARRFLQFTRSEMLAVRELNYGPRGSPHAGHGR